MPNECPKCQTSNPSESKFCMQCATPLPGIQATAHTKTIEIPTKDLIKDTTFAGRYQIIQELGRGGMGVVYKAHDTKLKRTVALKFLPSELTHISDVKERFIREAQAAAALDHPNICTVHEFDEAEEKSFISMAYIEGQSLRKKIESGSLDLNDALRIGIQVAEGLHEAHKKGVVHRDIKSANILMDKRNQPKIMDFGLARVSGESLLTKEGTTMGTIAYMSPEQARGEKVDQRSDIWSLGVVFYEMLTGQLPFKGEHEQAVVYSIRKDIPKPITEVNAEIPQSIEQVVEKALEKDADKRYQRVDELIDDLKYISAGIVPEEIKTRIRKAKFQKRKKVLLLSSAAISVIAVVMAVLSLFPHRAEAINSIAVLPLENLTGDDGLEYFVDGITDELIGQLQKIGAWRVLSRRSVMRYKGAEIPMPEITKELNVDAVVDGTVYEIGETVRVRVQLIDTLPKERSLWTQTYAHERADVLEMYNEMARAIADHAKVRLTADETSNLTTATQVDPEAYEAYLKGQFHSIKLTAKDLEIALQYYNLALEKEPDFAQAYAGIAGVWGARTYQGMLWSEVMPKIKAVVDKCIELDSSLPEAHYMIAGMATWYEFDWDKAEREFLLTLSLNPNYAQARVFYGLLLTGMGRFEEAIVQMERALELDPHSFMCQTYLGLPYYRSHRFDEAIVQVQKGLALEPNFGDALGILRNCYYEKGMYEEALTLQRKIYENGGDQDLLEALDRGYEEGGYKEGIRQTAEALAARLNRAYSLVIARLYTIAGEKELALDWLEIAFEERIQNLVYLNVTPKWDPLRSSPRFQELIRKMNYPVNVNK